MGNRHPIDREHEDAQEQINSKIALHERRIESLRLELCINEREWEVGLAEGCRPRQE